MQVQLPEEAARCIAESHFYTLQLDPHVTPYEINKRYGGVTATQISTEIQDHIIDDAMEREKSNRFKNRVKTWLNKFFWWLSM